MYQQINPSRRRIFAGGSRVYFTLVLAALILALAAPAAFAQHVSNPYVGAKVYVSPDYANEVATAEAAEPSLAGQMATVAKTPTFVWLDRIAAINGGAVNSNRLGLQGHISAAAAQANGAEIVVQLVIYDLPDRDCAALASNGELSIAGGDTPKGYTTPLTGTGIQEYENDYITPIYNVLAAAPSNVRFVLVIEDDSLPNLLTNTGVSFTDANCVLANAGVSNAGLAANWTQTATPTENIPLTGVYYQGISYALNTFHKLPNVYNYLDIGHHGWLGWTSNTAYAVAFFSSFAQQLSAGYSTIDGFITNTANYGPLTEPFIVWDEVAGGPETNTNLTSGIFTGDFYQWDPAIDELSYKTFFLQALTASTTGGYTDPRGQAHTPGGGFPSSIGFLIDTSRNGWGNTSAANGGGNSAYKVRPTAAGTSTVIDTFVNESKIDLRNSSGQWCNQENAGIGMLPTVNPTSGVSAYVWVKPPGEADGNYPGSVYNGVTATDGDPNCNPVTANPQAGADTIANSIPNSPSAGTFWITEFVQLVEDAYPVLASSTGGTGSFLLNASSSTLTIAQGASGTDTITVTDVSPFAGSVTLAASGLPTGVTASFATNPATASSVLTLTVASTAAAATSTITITGTSGSLSATTTIALTVSSVSTGSFKLSPSASTLSIAQSASGTDTITVTDTAPFAGSVTLAASGLPSGVTAAFGTNPTTASSVLTLTASSTATVGASTITITGTSGSLSATTTIALTVSSVSTGSFKLSPSASTLSIAQGASGTDTITVTDTAPFAGSVTLAASGLPTGVTAAFATNPATSTSVLTLTASSTAAAATSTITITGTSGSLSASTTVALTVTAVSCTPTAIVPYIQVGTAAWQQTNAVTVPATTTVVNLGPQPIAGTWSWTGPNGYTSAARQINAVPLGAGANVYVATYTNASNCKSTATFTITAPSSTGSFSLSRSASSLSVTQGSSATDTITVTDVSPFSGSVTLAASGLPSGVTAAFATNPATSTSVLTLTASSTATAGTSTVTIAGTSGTLSASTTIALTVNAVSTGSFKLAASASSLSIAQGASGTDTITVTDTAPFAGSVTLAASGLPAGVTAAFATNPATSTSVLTLSASSTATTGTSTVTITGTSGALTATTTIALTVTAVTTGAKCTVDYVISPQNTSAFGANITIVNNSSTAWTSWTLTWAFANGQTVSSLWNGIETQSGANVTVASESYNGAVAAGGTVSGVGFNGTWNGTTNAIPTAFSINGTACTVN